MTREELENKVEDLEENQKILVKFVLALYREDQETEGNLIGKVMDIVNCDWRVTDND